MPSKERGWKLVSEYGVNRYACGLRAGDQIELLKTLMIHNHDGAPTGKVHPAGGIWTVLSGSRQHPDTVWLREPSGNRHTWDDSEEIFEWFRPVAPADGLNIAMSYQIKLFAVARQLVGKDSTTVDLPTGANVATLRHALVELHPELAEILRHTRFAVNAEYATDETPIPKGAEIALIPPVSGG